MRRFNGLTFDNRLNGRFVRVQSVKVCGEQVATLAKQPSGQWRIMFTNDPAEFSFPSRDQAVGCLVNMHFDNIPVMRPVYSTEYTSSALSSEGH